MTQVEDIFSKVYAAGAKLVVLDSGLAVDGEIPNALKKKIRAHKDELLEALVGDPLEGPGWEARTILYRSALQWLEGEIEKTECEGASAAWATIDALCQQEVTDPLNAAWCDGDFGEFRAALRTYVTIGLHAARSKYQGGKARRPAVTAADGFGTRGAKQ